MQLIKNSTTVIFWALLLLCFSCKDGKHNNDINPKNIVLLDHDKTQGKVDVVIDGQLFTSYLYADTLLRKPVLFPVYSSSRNRITRGFPLQPNKGERVDHPHHYGIWMNHGDVNSVDYWNSAIIPKNKESRYGKIEHKSFELVESGDKGQIVALKNWVSDKNETELHERTKYIFEGEDHIRRITIHSTLTANNKVLFKDSKEGFFAIRVCRALEIPSDKPTKFYGERDIVDSLHIKKDDVTGYYINSEKVAGYPNVWGKRAEWMQLKGIVDKDSISICIFSHPNNPNHKPHWMARDYGLFAVNPFGSKIYTEGTEELNFKLNKDESVDLKYQVLIFDQNLPTKNQIDSYYNTFITDY